MRDTLSIADASKATGFTARQLRSYEAMNYIRKPLRITCGEIKYANTAQNTFLKSKNSSVFLRKVLPYQPPQRKRSI